MSKAGGSCEGCCFGSHEAVTFQRRTYRIWTRSNVRCRDGLSSDRGEIGSQDEYEYVLFAVTELAIF